MCDKGYWVVGTPMPRLPVRLNRGLADVEACVLNAGGVVVVKHEYPPIEPLISARRAVPKSVIGGFNFMVFGVMLTNG